MTKKEKKAKQKEEKLSAKLLSSEPSSKW